VLLLALIALPGCGLLPPQARQFLERLGAEWDALVAVLTGGRSPLAKKAGQKRESVGDENERSAANAEIAQEMLKVIYRRDLQDPKETLGWSQAMDQGASVEGIYNGLTRSSDYRKVESSAGQAAPAALQAFVRELLRLEAALPEPTTFTEESARPLARPVQPSLPEPGEKAAPAPSPVASRSRAAPEERGRELAQVFRAASVFTLKRVLGEEALKVIAEQKARGKLAEWYGNWAASVAKEAGVGFGLALRSKPDEVFHRSWAKQATEDRLVWEVLNRLHRILNETDRGSAKSP
jgi:hypothetical protein